MKAVCVSCFDYYDIRMRWIIGFLKDKGYDVTYLITDFNHFSKKPYTVDYGATKQLHVLSYGRNISLRRLLSHFMFSKKVLLEIKQEKPDLIYCVIPPNSLVKEIGKYKVKNPDVKLVLDVYDGWPESFPYGKRNFFIKMAFRYWANLRDDFINYADLLISVSKAGKANMDLKYNTEVKVVFPVLPLERLPQYSFAVDKKISFCYLGHVNHITDMELGTQILGRLAHIKQVDLHIIGEGQKKRQWMEELAVLGVKIICHGVVFESEKKRKIFEQCDLGLNIPRIEIGSTMALKSVEYMRYGLPFINSGLGDNEEIVATYNVGINTNDGNIIERLTKLTGDELWRMHSNCVECYRKVFLQQDYEKILSKVLK